MRKIARGDATTKCAFPPLDGPRPPYEIQSIPPACTSYAFVVKRELNFGGLRCTFSLPTFGRSFVATSDTPDLIPTTSDTPDLIPPPPLPQTSSPPPPSPLPPPTTSSDAPLNMMMSFMQSFRSKVSSLRSELQGSVSSLVDKALSSRHLAPPTAVFSKLTTQLVLPPLADETDAKPGTSGTVHSPGVVSSCSLYFVY